MISGIGISGLERLRRTVGSFPTEVGGFKPDFWKMNHNITDLGIPAESELRGIGIIHQTCAK